jgi:hypothetical protein
VIYFFSTRPSCIILSVLDSSFPLVSCTVSIMWIHISFFIRINGFRQQSLPPLLLSRFQKTKEKGQKDCEHPFNYICHNFWIRCCSIRNKFFSQYFSSKNLLLELLITFNWFLIFFLSFNQSSCAFPQSIFIENISITIQRCVP